jgi:hypothetical protein
VKPLPDLLSVDRILDAAGVCPPTLDQRITADPSQAIGAHASPSRLGVIFSKRRTKSLCLIPLNIEYWKAVPGGRSGRSPHWIKSKNPNARAAEEDWAPHSRTRGRRV